MGSIPITRSNPPPSGLRTGAAVAAVLALLGSLLPRCAFGLEVTDPGQGPVTLPAGSAGARELSGVTWAGGERYLAVSDKDAALYRLSVQLDHRAGTVLGAEVTGRVALGQGTDLEAVARAPDGSVYVSDEVGPAIRRYDAETGAARGVVRPPRVYANARRNLSLESLALSPDARTLWTANEEALKGDGATNRGADGQGTLVRLQRLRGDGRGGWRPDGQWAYRVDGVAPFFGRAPSGLVDLAVLPDGTLLALERAAGIVGMGSEMPSAQVGFRSRLYAVDLQGAADTSHLASLPPSVAAVRKTLLWEATFPGLNFEGMALGPPLAGGERSLLLLADDGNGLGQGLYALRIGPITGAGATPRRAAPPSLPARGRSAAPGRRRAATARPP